MAKRLSCSQKLYKTKLALKEANELLGECSQMLRRVITAEKSKSKKKILSDITEQLKEIRKERK